MQGCYFALQCFVPLQEGVFDSSSLDALCWSSLCPGLPSHTEGLSLSSGMRVTPCSMSGVPGCSPGHGVSALLGAPRCHSSSWAAALMFSWGCWTSGAEIWSSSKAARFCTEQTGVWASCALHLWIQQEKSLYPSLNLDEIMICLKWKGSKGSQFLLCSACRESLHLLSICLFVLQSLH